MNGLKIFFVASIVLLSGLTSSVVNAQTIATGYPRTPWAASCVTAPSTVDSNVAGCDIIVPGPTPAIPQGFEVVVQTLTLSGTSDPSRDNMLIEVTTTSGGNPFSWNNQIHRSADFTPGPHLYYSSQALTMYIDPRPGIVNILLATELTKSPVMGPSGIVYLTGYTVPLSALSAGD